jgi:hypothetical protein
MKSLFTEEYEHNHIWQTDKCNCIIPKDTLIELFDKIYMIYMTTFDPVEDVVKYVLQKRGDTSL